MRINHESEIKRNAAAKLLLCLGVTVTVFAGVTVSARAQSGVAQRQAETGITTYYYAYKSNAVGKLNAEKKRGKRVYNASLRQGDWAKMWYDEKRREWAVAVKPRLSFTLKWS